jgi:hypothetical protein
VTRSALAGYEKSLDRLKFILETGFTLIRAKIGGEGIVEIIPVPLIPSFARKRESIDFSYLLWAPAFAGATTSRARGISAYARKIESWADIC